MKEDITFDREEHPDIAWFAGKYYTLTHPQCVRSLCEAYAEQRAQAAEAERDRAKAELAAIMKTLYIDVYDEDEGEPYSYLLPAEPEPIVCESISEAVKEFYELCDKEHNKLTEELERLRKEAK